MEFGEERIGRKTRIANKRLYIIHPEMQANWTPISKSNLEFRVAKQDQKTVQRVQYPLVPASACIVHHVQGCTISTGDVLDLAGPTVGGLHYTALSRFRKLSDVNILNLNETKIGTNEDAIAEMQRLKRSKRIELRGQSFMHQPYGTVHLAHQNARSLHLHIDQLRTDAYVRDLDFLVCTDSRAIPADPDSHYELPGYIMQRVDDTSIFRGANSMILYIRDRHMFTSSLERTQFFTIVKMALILCSEDEDTFIDHMDIIAVYRRPNTPVKAFIDSLRLYILGRSRIHPTIILGDFNIDLYLNDYACNDLHSLMAGGEFHQHIHIATTPQGSLLDHVWTNTPCSTDIYPTYCSDHTATSVFLPRYAGTPRSLTLHGRDGQDPQYNSNNSSSGLHAVQ